MILEAACTKCGVIFNPADEDDLIHTDDDCGGQGELLGMWIPPEVNS